MCDREKGSRKIQGKGAEKLREEKGNHDSFHTLVGRGRGGRVGEGRVKIKLESLPKQSSSRKKAKRQLREEVARYRHASEASLRKRK